ncbi:hypothetical protein JTB14_018191 [Gonioctena quinquepunctata]|nr:hypothetical protein JTB14_018191 [Gonioctena quinquepunctata]
MVKNICIILIATFILGSSSVPSRQRRQFDWGNNFDTWENNNGIGRQLPESPPATSGNTNGRPSPTLARCVDSCRTTTLAHYNPVCGSNGISYDNRAKLECAARCGTNVQFVRLGTCQPL